MSLFGTLLSKIFPRNHPAASQGQQTAAGQQTASQPATAQQATPAQRGPAPGTTSTQPAPMTEVDVEKILDDMARQNSQKLNWRTSIVDLMKLVGMDSSLAARKELAKELDYSGDTNDSAAMNMWLHKQVMTRIAQNGGKVPSDLLH